MDFTIKLLTKYSLRYILGPHLKAKSLLALFEISKVLKFMRYVELEVGWSLEERITIRIMVGLHNEMLIQIPVRIKEVIRIFLESQ